MIRRLRSGGCAAGSPANPETRWTRLSAGLIISAVLLGLPACGKIFSPAAHEDAEEEQAAAAEPTRTLAGTGAAMSGSLRDITYEDWDRERRQSADNNFMGFRCVGNCLDHIAGYQWGRANKIDQARFCTGNTWAMVEGCVAWATQKSTPDAAAAGGNTQ